MTSADSIINVSKRTLRTIKDLSVRVAKFIIVVIIYTKQKIYILKVYTYTLKVNIC